jgi:hypothetical protein
MAFSRGGETSNKTGVIVFIEGIGGREMGRQG